MMQKRSGEYFLVGCFGQVIYGTQEAQRSRDLQDAQGYCLQENEQS